MSATTAAPTSISINLGLFQKHDEDGAGMTVAIVVCSLVFVFIGFICFLMSAGGSSAESGGPPPTEPENQPGAKDAAPAAPAAPAAGTELSEVKVEAAPAAPAAAAPGTE